MVGLQALTATSPDVLKDVIHVKDITRRDSGGVDRGLKDSGIGLADAEAAGINASGKVAIVGVTRLEEIYVNRVSIRE